MHELRTWQLQMLAEVGQRLREFGFERGLKEQSFVKRASVGRLTFHLAFVKHKCDFDVTADVAIRFDQVEDLVNRYETHPLLRESDKANTHTLGCELGNLSEGRQRRWTVASKSDTDSVASSIVEAFAAVALPYFEQFSQPERALQILSGDGPDSWLHAPFHDNRAKLAVAMALQVHGKEAAKQLAKRKLAFLESRNEFGTDSFREFLRKLGLSAPSELPGCETVA